jgi:hypothetical protein
MSHTLTEACLRSLSFCNNRLTPAWGFEQNAPGTKVKSVRALPFLYRSIESNQLAYMLSTCFR